MNKLYIFVLIVAIVLVYVVLNTSPAGDDKGIIDRAQIEEIKPVVLQDDSTTWDKIKKLFE